MEKYRDSQRELHCVFVDLEKAYDRVPREELWYCMRKSGVAEKYVRVVQDMYERSRTVVRCAVGQTEEFKVEVGLHQGSALSPFLFAIVMDQLSEEVRQESPWTMMFADDIVICSESREQVEENLERWRFALERRGMKVSRSKTEYMCVNEREGSGTVRLQGEEVKKVQEFKYLGSTVQSNGEVCERDPSIHQASLLLALVTAVYIPHYTTIVPVPKKQVRCLNDYHPVALTPIIMKCFERLVLPHIKASIPTDLDSHQFAYHGNRSTEDAISTALHTSLSHLEYPSTYVRMLFVDFSSAFNTIVPHKLWDKLNNLGLTTTLCSWILDFLTNRPQNVRVRNHTSATITLNTGAPQGCVLSPALFTLFTHDCKPIHSSNTIVNFADDTTVVGLISGNNETHLVEWCVESDLVLNTTKTKEIVVDYRRTQKPPPLHINGAEVERVNDIKFLHLHITKDLTWTINTTYLVKKAQQRLFFLRKLKKAKVPSQLLVNFYRSTIESTHK
ncbi:hypothetical protein QTP86_027916 [Hemibagrus guttatus]|nr:hypothetical protein QTP86_027916 [Hemibagrus guttatus]